MKINHTFDLSPDVGTDIEVLGNANYFLQAMDIYPGDIACIGTVGTFGACFACIGCVAI